MTTLEEATDDLMSSVGGNTGNLAFRSGLSRHLVNPVHLPWDTPVDVIRAAGDVIVLPLANQLGPHTDLGREAQKIHDIDMPVVAVGLGAQAVGTNA